MRIQFAYLLLMLSVSDALFTIRRLSFQEKHILDGENPGECSALMGPINNAMGECKPTNTFILAPYRTVARLCQSQIHQETVTSTTGYDIFICNGGGNYPHCRYRHNGPFNAHIKITCFKGEPEHYIEHVPPRQLWSNITMPDLCCSCCVRKLPIQWIWLCYWYRCFFD